MLFTPEQTLLREAQPLSGAADDYDGLLDLVGDAGIVLLGEASIRMRSAPCAPGCAPSWARSGPPSVDQPSFSFEQSASTCYVSCSTARRSSSSALRRPSSASVDRKAHRPTETVASKATMATTTTTGHDELLPSVPAVLMSPPKTPTNSTASQIETRVTPPHNVPRVTAPAERSWRCFPCPQLGGKRAFGYPGFLNCLGRIRRSRPEARFVRKRQQNQDQQADLRFAEDQLDPVESQLACARGRGIPRRSSGRTPAPLQLQVQAGARRWPAARRIRFSESSER